MNPPYQTRHSMAPSHAESGRVRCWSLSTIALVLVVAAFGCYRYPETVRPGPKSDDAQTLKVATDRLNTAERAKVWTDEDQKAFNETLPRLSFDTRIRLAKQLSGLITMERVKLVRSAGKEEPPPMCRCVPAQCVPPAPPVATPARP
jgi:hypothetical protein